MVPRRRLAHPPTHAVRRIYATQFILVRRLRFAIPDRSAMRLASYYSTPAARHLSPMTPASSVSPSLVPFVSVAVRSYRRLPYLVEALNLLLQQDYPHFEIVVIEQSGSEREAYRSALETLSRDVRVRLLQYGALGAGRARNEAARQSRGDIVLFLDDDDLPLDNTWISAHVANYADPNCVAVSGRQVVDQRIHATKYDTKRNHRLCLRYSWLKLPRGRMYHTRRLIGVTQVTGTNASIRRTAIERAGGWQPEFDHDEDSFNFRFARVKAKNEYFAYDPRAAILRRLEIPGGVGRRQKSVHALLGSELQFFHAVIRRNFPLRFWALYPLYLVLALVRAFKFYGEARRIVGLSNTTAGTPVYGESQRETA